MTFNSLLNSRKGQARILEAVIAAAIILTVFSASAFLLRPSDIKVLKEREDLDRLGYNVLQQMVESKTIEDIPENPALSDDAQANLLKTVLEKSLPSTMFFNLTVLNCSDPTGASWVVLQPVISVDNNSTEPFSNSLEVSSTGIIYTSEKGNIYYVVLVLSRNS